MTIATGLAKRAEMHRALRPRDGGIVAAQATRKGSAGERLLYVLRVELVPSDDSGLLFAEQVDALDTGGRRGVGHVLDPQHGVITVATSLLDLSAHVGRSGVDRAVGPSGRRLAGRGLT